MKQTKKHIIYLILIILIGITPLIFVKNSEFGGADGKAEEVITEINPNYEPWATSPIEPPGRNRKFTICIASSNRFRYNILYYWLLQREE